MHELHFQWPGKYIVALYILSALIDIDGCYTMHYKYSKTFIEYIDKAQKLTSRIMTGKILILI